MANGCIKDGSCVLCMFAVLLVTDLVKIILGLSYSRDGDTNESRVCSQMEHVPLYLKVSARAPWYFYKIVSSKCCCVVLFALFGLFYFCWNIAGSAMIYPTFKAMLLNETDPACNKYLLVFATYAVSMDWIGAIWVSCIVSACLCDK